MATGMAEMDFFPPFFSLFPGCWRGEAEQAGSAGAALPHQRRAALAAAPEEEEEEGEREGDVISWQPPRLSHPSRQRMQRSTRGPGATGVLLRRAPIPCGCSPEPPQPLGWVTGEAARGWAGMRATGAGALLGNQAGEDGSCPKLSSAGPVTEMPFLSQLMGQDTPSPPGRGCCGTEGLSCNSSSHFVHAGTQRAACSQHCVLRAPLSSRIRGARQIPSP